jgi:glycosyltransferase involved in cell wall biosynthesis
VDTQVTSSEKPLVWHVAAAYQVPGGIEAHVLHYATEMRNHGFTTRVVVFKPLPAASHRFLDALREREIRIDSLDDLAHRGAFRREAALLAPWWFYTRLIKRMRPDLKSFRMWVHNRSSLREFDRMLRAEQPSVIHVFGRQRTESWRHFPLERTIFHEMMTGTVDAHWAGYELDDFRAFAERAARYFAPGEGVAANVRREFGIRRQIVPIYTLCPDEVRSDRVSQAMAGKTKTSLDSQSAPNADTPPSISTRQSSIPRLRFGVICRLTGQKGIVFLLDALKQYHDRQGDIDFTFAGIGPMEAQIRTFAASNHLSGVRVTRVPNAPAILNTLDVFVHPSVDDAMPMAISEALMCSVPCIVCRVGGCADLVRDGMEGFVIEPRKTDQILRSMERFSRMPVVEFDEFRRRARARYEEVCLPASVGQVVARHYREILAGAGGAPARQPALC